MREQLSACFGQVCWSGFSMLEAINGQILIIVAVCLGVCGLYYFGKYLTNFESSFVSKKLSEYSSREETSWLEIARQKYSDALGKYATAPSDERALERVLKHGRNYSRICAEQNNDKLFNETALQDDLAAARAANEFTNRLNSV